MSKKQKGFTLIELIVTIVIIGILAAVAMPKMGNSVEAAAKAADTATATAFESGIAMAMADLASDPARRANPYPRGFFFPSAQPISAKFLFRRNLFPRSRLQCATYFREKLWGMQPISAKKSPPYR